MPTLRVTFSRKVTSRLRCKGETSKALICLPLQLQPAAPHGMKFKATLHNAELMLRTRRPLALSLMNVDLSQALEKIAKSCIVCLTERKIQLILTSDATDGMQVWSGLNSSSVLKEMIIESLQQNMIYFELSLDHLHKALKSASGNGAEVVMKLTKKNGAPYLSFSIVVQVRVHV